MHPAAISSLISILWQCSLSVTRRAICIRQFTVDLTKKLDLQIGERVYRVHKYFLIRESSFFRDMFSLPQGDSNTDSAASVEGQSVEHPIVLADTTELEFDSILEYLYFG